MANQTLSEPIQRELFEIKDSDVVWLPSAYVSTLILVKRPEKQEFLGKPQSNSQQFVWLEELLTVSRFKKSLMNALQLTMTYIETVDSFCGSCCWDKHRQTKQLVKILIWLSAVLNWWTKLRKQRLRVKEESNKAYIEEELSFRKRRKEIHQDRPWRLWAAGEWCWYWRSGEHKGSRTKGGVFLGPARVLIQERETTAEGVRMKVLSGSQRVLLLFGLLHSTCVLFPSLRKYCAVSQTLNPSVSKTSSDVCHTAHFLISRHRQMLLTTLGKTKSQVGTNEAHEIQAVAVLSGRNLMQPHVWELI